MTESIMSFFNAPITNKVPSGVCSVAGLHAYISSDSHLKELTQRVRADTENDKAFRGKKQTLLPYVTPAGIFSYCREQCIMVPSGDFVIDIDHLASVEEAAMWRDRLFTDEVLQPDLAFVSPGAKETFRALPAESHRYAGTLVRQCSTHRLGLPGMASRTKGRYRQCRYVESLLPGIRRRSEVQNLGRITNYKLQILSL